MPDDFTLRLKNLKPRDRRLGRHVGHDSRSRRFPAAARDPRTLASTRHQVHIGFMDQGPVGSCTGHSIVYVVASGPFWAASQGVLTQIDPHQYAVGVYSDATKIDPWPGVYEPDDTGSDGLSVAKVVQARGLINGYQHAFSLEAALTALADRAVIVGTTWLDGMFDVGSDGHVNVSGPPAGGHEYCLDELDVENRRAWIHQSWGDGWGQGGRAWMSWDELGRLLADDGDCTVLIPNSEPAPQPTPVPPQPIDPARPTTADRMLAEALDRFLDNRATPVYLTRAAKVWLPTVKE